MHGADGTGHAILRKTLRWDQELSVFRVPYLGETPPTSDPCAGARREVVSPGDNPGRGWMRLGSPSDQAGLAPLPRGFFQSFACGGHGCPLGLAPEAADDQGRTWYAAVRNRMTVKFRKNQVAMWGLNEFRIRCD